MKAECPNGHTENLSWEELRGRLLIDDFSCNECDKQYSYEIDQRFWEKYNDDWRRFASDDVVRVEKAQAVEVLALLDNQISEVQETFSSVTEDEANSLDIDIEYSECVDYINKYVDVMAVIAVQLGVPTEELQTNFNKEELNNGR